MPIFFAKYKKILIAIGFIIIVFLLGYLLYSVFFKKAPAPAGQPTATATPPGGLPISPGGTGQIVAPTGPSGLPVTPGPETGQKPSEVATGGLTQTSKASDMSGIGITLGANNTDVQLYNKNDGKFYTLDKDGNAAPLSNKVFHNVESVTWSPTKNKAILEYPDGANIIYDFSSNKQITLPAHWKDFDFSPSGDNIVMKSIGLDPANRYLAITNEDGTKTKAIESLGENEAIVYPSWSPNNQSVAMYIKGVDFNRQEVFFVGQNDENFKSMVIEGRGFQYKWQPDGEKLLYSVYSDNNGSKPMLWIANANGEAIGSGRKSLGLETWANKCAYANTNEVYCAVPEKLEDGAGMFPELAKNTKDKLYKIDTQTGLQQLVAIPDGTFTMSNIIIANSGKNLYFTDNTTEKLYKINLK